MHVRAGILEPGIVRQIDQHRELLYEDVRVRLQPEAFGILAVFDPQVRIRKDRFSSPARWRCAREVLEPGHDAAANLELGLVLGVEIDARGVVGLAPAVEDQIGRRCEGQLRDRRSILVGSGFSKSQKSKGEVLCFERSRHARKLSATGLAPGAVTVPVMLLSAVEEWNEPLHLADSLCGRTDASGQRRSASSSS